MHSILSAKEARQLAVVGPHFPLPTVSLFTCFIARALSKTGSRYKIRPQLWEAGWGMKGRRHTVHKLSLEGPPLLSGIPEGTEVNTIHWARTYVPSSDQVAQWTGWCSVFPLPPSWQERQSQPGLPAPSTLLLGVLVAFCVVQSDWMDDGDETEWLSFAKSSWGQVAPMNAIQGLRLSRWNGSAYNLACIQVPCRGPQMDTHSPWGAQLAWKGGSE